MHTAVHNAPPTVEELNAIALALQRELASGHATRESISAYTTASYLGNQARQHGVLSSDAYFDTLVGESTFLSHASTTNVQREIVSASSVAATVRATHTVEVFTSFDDPVRTVTCDEEETWRKGYEGWLLDKSELGQCAQFFSDSTSSTGG